MFKTRTAPGGMVKTRVVDREIERSNVRVGSDRKNVPDVQCPCDMSHSGSAMRVGNDGCGRDVVESQVRLYWRCCPLAVADGTPG